MRGTSYTSLRLLVEPLDGEATPRDAQSLPCVEVVSSVRALDVATFAEHPELARPTEAHATALRLEAVALERGPALLVVTPPEADVRINGLRAPLVSVLDVGDQIRIPHAVLHVTRFREPEVGAPPAGLVGRKCGVCLVAVDEAATVLVHDCGAPLHLEPDATPEERRLQCALLGDCPTCQAPVSLDAGFVWLPEL